MPLEEDRTHRGIDMKVFGTTHGSLSMLVHVNCFGGLDVLKKTTVKSLLVTYYILKIFLNEAPWRMVLVDL